MNVWHGDCSLATPEPVFLMQEETQHTVCSEFLVTFFCTLKYKGSNFSAFMFPFVTQCYCGILVWMVSSSLLSLASNTTLIFTLIRKMSFYEYPDFYTKKEDEFL